MDRETYRAMIAAAFQARKAARDADDARKAALDRLPSWARRAYHEEDASDYRMAKVLAMRDEAARLAEHAATLTTAAKNAKKLLNR